MVNFVLKRLLVMIPALWLLSSIVFLLSRSMPGNMADLQAEEFALQSGGGIKAEARIKAYRQQLHRTGQDMPLFYMGLGTAAEPDTLYKVFPESDREALQQLILTFGNWPQISDYYKNLLQLRKSAVQADLPVPVQKDLNYYSGQLLTTGDPEKIKRIFKDLKTVITSKVNPELAEMVLAVEISFKKIEADQTPNLNLRPKLFFYGTTNQYHSWLARLPKADLGTSYRDSRPVAELISEALGITFWLALSAFISVCFLGPIIGMVLSRKSNRSFRPAILGGFYVLESIPLFVVALALLALVSYFGFLSDFPEEAALGAAVFCLILVNLPYLASQSFAALQKELGQQYVLTARAKGFSERQVLSRHALRNSLLPVITTLSDLFPALLAGTLVLEMVFSLPGIGRLLVGSVLSRDYEVITGLVLLIGLIKIISHLLADLLYAFTDPRIRFGS